MKRFARHAALLSMLALFLVPFTAPGQAYALTPLSGEQIVLKNPLTDDLYVVGREIDIDQPVTGDVIVIGGTVNIDEDVSGDVLVLGGRVTLSGNIGDDVRVAGGTVSVSGNIKDDLILIGGNIELMKTGSVGGSMLLYGGRASVDGTIAENIQGSAKVVKIKGWVNGNVRIDASQLLSITPLAKIRGDLTYSSRNPSVIPDGTVGGKLERVAPSGSEYTSLLFGFYTIAMLTIALWNFLSLLLLGALLLALLPQECMKWSDNLRKHFWQNLGVGFLMITAGTAFIAFCAVTIIGVPLALILGLGAMALWYISQLAAGLFLGSALLKPKTRSPRRMFGVLALGLFVLGLISLVPVAGQLAHFVLVLASFGVLLRRKYEWALTLRSAKK